MLILDFIYKPTSLGLRFAPGLKDKFSEIERPFQKIHIIQEGESFRHEPGTGIYMMDFPDTPEGNFSELEDVRSVQMFEFLKILFHEEYPKLSAKIIFESLQIIEVFLKQAEEEIPAIVSYNIEQKEKFKYYEADINPINPKKEYIRLENGFYKKYKCNSSFGSLTAKVHAVSYRMLPYLKELEVSYIEDLSLSGKKASKKKKAEENKVKAIKDDLAHYLTDEGKEILPLIVKEYSGSAPKVIAPLLFALYGKSFMETNPAYIGKAKLYRAVKNTLNIGFNQESLRISVLNHNEGEPILEAEIKKHQFHITKLLEENNF